jgi:glycosyltransferase involved in cell wall biosynthesis
MHEPRPLVFGFAFNEWHTPWWMARQHLFARLVERGWPVVYSTGPQSLWERNTDKWRHGSLTHSFDIMKSGDNRKLLVDRPGKCLPQWKNEGAWHDFIVAWHARHLMRGAGADARRQRIAYLWHPRFWPYVDQLKANYVVFHIYDAWNVKAWPDTYRRRLERLAERADMVIATAENMARILPGIGPGRARIFPHGVDFEAIRAGADAPCPADLALIPRPRIGYVGRVNLKLDFPLIIQAAAMRQDWHWVFIGETGIGANHSFEGRPAVKADWEQLKRTRNVHLLGVKHRDEVPAYLHNFDVLSLPFNSSCVGFPTKLFEYFASGKPIVSWNCENIRPVSNLIDIADGPQEWVDAISRAISGTAKATASQRIDYARSEDWSSRTDTLERWLLEMTQLSR